MNTVSSFLLTVCILSLLPLSSVGAFERDPYLLQDAYEVTGVYAAWQQTTGSKDVVVAIIDNGFDHYHPDLVQNVWSNADEIAGNGIDDDANGYIDDMVGWNFVPADTNGDGTIDSIEERGNNNPRPTIDGEDGDPLVTTHATAVAGIIGATGYNGLLGAGINWRVSLMNLKVVGNSGNGTIAYVPAAIRYAVDNGADVISMSVVGYVDDPTGIIDAVQYAYEHDVVLVAAAGNNRLNLNLNPRYPVCSDASTTTSQIIGVSAIAPDRAFARFSNYGSTCVDITAPGIGVSSTAQYLGAHRDAVDPWYIGELQGTSFSTPMVAATAALIRSQYRDMSAADVIRSILTSTSKTPPADEVLYTNLFGAGLLRVDQALFMAASLQSPVTAQVEFDDEVVYHDIRLSETVVARYFIEKQELWYLIGGNPVYARTVADTPYVQPLVVIDDTIVVLEHENAEASGQYLSLYTSQGVGISQRPLVSSDPFDGLFTKSGALYGYRTSDDSVTIEHIDMNTGMTVAHQTLLLPGVRILTYDEAERVYVGLQYTKTLFRVAVDGQYYRPVIVATGSTNTPIGVAIAQTNLYTIHPDMMASWDAALRSQKIIPFGPIIPIAL